MQADGLRRGIALFNRAEFFEAHEVLEDVWRAAPADQKKYFQGLVQTAVAFHHFSTGNRIGMRSVMERAMRNLDGCGAEFHGVHVARLRKSVAEWLKSLDAGQTVPSPPRIEIVEESKKTSKAQEI